MVLLWYREIHWAALITTTLLATVPSTSADLEWNSLTDYFKSLERGFMTTTTTTESPVKVDFLSSNLNLSNYLNISKPAKPPLLGMFPGNPHEKNFTKEDVGEPLILTPYIERHQLAEARQMAKVKSQELDRIAPSYSGYFTVNKKYNSNLFFWYIPAKEFAKDAPLVLWLQGGPGGSSLFGLFIEHGPYFIGESLNATARNLTWAKTYHMLYIDQPAGTGFSFTDDPRGFASNQIEVANDLYEALTQFYTVFPELLMNEFYVTGESYAGKYVPAISFKIHKMNKEDNSPKIPLKGLAIGDGLSDPISQMSYGDFLFQTGLVDENDRDTMIRMSKITKQYIKQGRWSEASDMFDNMLAFFGQRSGLTFVYNYLLQGQPEAFTYYPKFLNRADVRKAIHVGNTTYSDVNSEVYEHLKKDIPKSVKPWIETLLNSNYKVMIYSGQVDVIIAYPQTEQFIANLRWKGSEAYRNADRRIWRVHDEVAGYAREVDNLKQVMVRNSGHILPFDQPLWGYNMIRRFIDDVPFAS